MDPHEKRQVTMALDPDEQPDPIARLVARLDEALTRDLGGAALPNPESWRLVKVRAYERWTRVAEVLLARPDRTLAFIVAPRDPDQPAFRRTARYDLVYYSDDLPPSEHDGLYGRDKETIERFASWLEAWDNP